MKHKNFREQFAELLASTQLSSMSTQEDWNETWKNINQLLRPNIPPRLFRFRRCTAKNIISFERGEIMVCVANTFSDKYDSNIYVNKSQIESVINMFFDSGIIKSLYEVKEDESIYPLLEPMFGKEKTEKIKNLNQLTSLEQRQQILDRSYWKKVIEEMKGLADSQINYIKRDRFTKIACFTENIQAKSMWDLYADGYKGFALGYDFRNFHEKGCSNCPKSNCENQLRTYANLFPIIYSNTRYDATDTVYNLVVRQLLNSLGVNESLLPPIDQLYWYKAYLYKDKKDYSREKEWRLICRCPNRMNDDYSEISDLNCIKSIYYGSDIDPYYKKHLREIAKAREVEEYDVCIDQDSLKYKLKITRL